MWVREVDVPFHGVRRPQRRNVVVNVFATSRARGGCPGIDHLRQWHCPPATVHELAPVRASWRTRDLVDQALVPMAPYRRMLHDQALSLECLPIKRLGPTTQLAGAPRVH